METILARIVGLAAQTFKVPASRLGPDSNPSTVRSWDSFAHLEFVEALEKMFQIHLTPKDILSIDSLGLAERVIAAKVSGG